MSDAGLETARELLDALILELVDMADQRRTGYEVPAEQLAEAVWSAQGIKVNLGPSLELESAVAS